MGCHLKMRTGMPGAFHKSAYDLVDRNVKEEWPSILTEASVLQT